MAQESRSNIHGVDFALFPTSKANLRVNNPVPAPTSPTIIPGLILQAATISLAWAAISRLSPSNFWRKSLRSGFSYCLLIPGLTLFSSWAVVERSVRKQMAMLAARDEKKISSIFPFEMRWLASETAEPCQSQITRADIFGQRKKLPRKACRPSGKDCIRQTGARTILVRLQSSYQQHNVILSSSGNGQKASTKSGGGHASCSTKRNVKVSRIGKPRVLGDGSDRRRSIPKQFFGSFDPDMSNLFANASTTQSVKSPFQKPA